MTTHLQDAITFALDHELDNKEIIRVLIHNDPGMFFRLTNLDVDQIAADLMRQSPVQFLAIAKTQVSTLKKITEINGHIKHGNLVSAIKALREDAALGLKEAKDIIVYVRDILVQVGKMNAPANITGSNFNGGQAITLSPAHRNMAEGLIIAF
jgi:hypothetical protein